MIRLRSTLLLAVCVMAACLNAAYALGSGSKAIGNVLLTDGQRLDSITIELPRDIDQQVKITIGGKTRKLPTDSIDCMVVWHKKNPGNQYIFKPFRSEIMNLDTGESTGLSKRTFWLCLEQVGEHVSLWSDIGRPSLKKGKMQFNFANQYSGASLRYALIHGHSHPSYMPDKEKDCKKWIRHYFKDDPELIRRLDAGEYQAKASVWGNKYTDIARIIKEYNPKKE
ncbi:MAG: hypothetical protein K2L62_05165 [Muribaculaceae bacterium]|nr:hypothetical protein [Muribaculaceae bacterium]